jgi:hypothetical protein
VGRVRAAAPGAGRAGRGGVGLPRVGQLLVWYDPQPPFDAGSVEKAGPVVLARAQELALKKD